MARALLCLLPTDDCVKGLNQSSWTDRIDLIYKYNDQVMKERKFCMESKNNKTLYCTLSALSAYFPGEFVLKLNIICVSPLQMSEIIES